MQIRKTKIIATIGPASQDPDTLEKLVRNGLDVAHLERDDGEMVLPFAVQKIV